MCEKSFLSGELLPTQKARIQEALTHALKEIKHIPVLQHLVAQEFWHSLNRKNLISNSDVEGLIYLTIKNIE